MFGLLLFVGVWWYMSVLHDYNELALNSVFNRYKEYLYHECEEQSILIDLYEASNHNNSIGLHVPNWGPHRSLPKQIIKEKYSNFNLNQSKFEIISQSWVTKCRIVVTILFRVCNAFEEENTIEAAKEKSSPSLSCSDKARGWHLGLFCRQLWNILLVWLLSTVTRAIVTREYEIASALKRDCQSCLWFLTRNGAH